MLTASLLLDLSEPPADLFRESDRHKVWRAGLEDAPDGTRVVIFVGSRTWTVDEPAARELHKLSDRLQLDIRGHDGQTIAAWHRAIRDGGLGVAA